jgi:hypothetical protein
MTTEKWIILLVACVFGGNWLYSLVLGKADYVHTARTAPGRFIAGLVFFCGLVLIGLVAFGYVVEGCQRD